MLYTFRYKTGDGNNIVGTDRQTDNWLRWHIFKYYLSCMTSYHVSQAWRMTNGNDKTASNNKTKKHQNQHKADRRWLLNKLIVKLYNNHSSY